MLSTLILAAAALTCQAPATHSGPKTDAELRAIMAQINARAATPAARAKRKAEADYRKVRDAELFRRSEAARPAREAAAREYRAQAAAARAAAQEKAERDYRAMLPFMMEQQRQQIERMGQIERNAYLQRMANVAEYQAQTDKQRADYFTWWLMQNRPR